MNAITKTGTSAVGIPSENDLVQVLQASLYPGAKPESVRLVLAWCRATGRDPMKKPIHIVPMYVRDAVSGQGGMRDVLMPGISAYRTDAATTGEYAGKSEPEFGPETTRDFDGVRVTFPLWCKVTVYRLVNREARPFPSKEYWVENYATGKEKKGVNDMWRKRPYAQLAKCAESQALRMAFPEETGNTNTAEEMEGKTYEGMTVEAATPLQSVSASRPALLEHPRDPVDNDAIPDFDPPPVDKLAIATDRLIALMEACGDETVLSDLMNDPQKVTWREKLAKSRPELELRIADAHGTVYARLTASQAAPADEPAPFGSDDAGQP